MKYVITGSSGFVGRNIIKKLIKEGNEVYAITTNFSINEDILIFIKGAKIIYVESLSNLSKDILDGSIIIHCAWENVRNIEDFSHYFHTKEQIQFLKLVSQTSAKKLVITGTCYEFGMTSGAVSVKTNTNPNTPYSQSKNFVHFAAKEIIGNNSKIEFTWTRLFYIYGDGQHEKSFYTQLVSSIEKGRESFNMSKGEQLYDYLNVSDVANYLSIVGNQKSPQIVHICSGFPISLRSLAEKILEEKNSYLKLNLGFYPYRKDDSIAIWGTESFQAQMNMC